MKDSCLEILLKIAGFHNFAKSREPLMFGDFLEIISGLSYMSYVKSRERVVFGYFLKIPGFGSYVNLVKGLCLEILLKIVGFSQLCKVS